MELFLLMIGAIIIYYGVIPVYFAYRKANKHKSLLEEVPIYWSNQLGRDFVVIGSVSSARDDKFDAEIDIMNQAKRLGADAIICTPIAISNHSSGGISTSTGFDGRTKFNDTRSIDSAYHYNGSAIKFKENSNTSSSSQIIQVNSDDLQKVLEKLESNTIEEIEKTKKLLDNALIDENEYQERISLMKKRLIEKKELVKYEMSEEGIRNKHKIMMDSKLSDFIQQKIKEGYDYNEVTKILSISSSPIDYKIEQNENGDCRVIR